MFISHFLSSPISAIIYIIAIVVAVTVHEFCHAKMADHLGDPTAASLGRVTLNPLAHLDPVGSVLFLLFGFGWGKPVPFDLYNLDNPKRDSALIALVGPASNFAMAIVMAILMRLLPLGMIGETFIWVNIVLGIFNLLPFAPLDGFKIVGGLLSDEQAHQWYTLERYGIIFLMLFIFPLVGSRSMLDIFVSPVVSAIAGFLVN